MTYGGARVTDELCQMNKWGRCSLPLRALELGLKYRQLDTISVFLRTRQNSEWPDTYSKICTSHEIKELKLEIETNIYAIMTLN